MIIVSLPRWLKQSRIVLPEWRLGCAVCHLVYGGLFGLGGFVRGVRVALCVS
jgi:hypothetical protein